MNFLAKWKRKLSYWSEYFQCLNYTDVNIRNLMIALNELEYIGVKIVYSNHTDANAKYNRIIIQRFTNLLQTDRNLYFRVQNLERKVLTSYRNAFGQNFEKLFQKENRSSKNTPLFMAVKAKVGKNLKYHQIEYVL